MISPTDTRYGGTQAVMTVATKVMVQADDRWPVDQAM